MQICQSSVRSDTGKEVNKFWKVALSSSFYFSRQDENERFLKMNDFWREHRHYQTLASSKKNWHNLVTYLAAENYVVNRW